MGFWEVLGGGQNKGRQVTLDKPTTRKKLHGKRIYIARQRSIEFDSSGVEDACARYDAMFYDPAGVEIHSMLSVQEQSQNFGALCEPFRVEARVLRPTPEGS